MELIYCDDTKIRIFGSNVFGLEDKKTVSYEWNERFIPLLEDRGFDIISIPGSQLAIGGGAPLPDLSNPQGLKKDSRGAVFLSSFSSLRKGSMILRPAFSTRRMYFFASNFFW